eukprot:CAMPEP_0198204688 /NCGR_PEP_ID=MMETSP1445-20131203/8122_1 /TAXON_ID=36898 /ORGANISM="Pyramimonas sp., Strain CCMP2087" /LENGTH=779 /DNA_ID=CAMNT_0043876681 /DNA_START=410 /DNA_END=2746 /DNA_ORIENTATION=+
MRKLHFSRYSLDDIDEVMEDERDGRSPPCDHPSASLHSSRPSLSGSTTVLKRKSMDGNVSANRTENVPPRPGNVPRMQLSRDKVEEATPRASTEEGERQGSSAERQEKVIPQTVTNTVDSNLDTHKSVQTGLENILLPYGRPVQRNFTKFSDHANVDSTSLLLGASHSQCLDLIPTDDDREVFKTTLKRGQELLIVVRHQLQEEKAGEARCLYGRFMGVKPVTLPCGLVGLVMTDECCEIYIGQATDADARKEQTDTQLRLEKLTGHTWDDHLFFVLSGFNLDVTRKSEMPPEQRLLVNSGETFGIAFADCLAKVHPGVRAVNSSLHGCHNHTRRATSDGVYLKIPFGADSLKGITPENLKTLVGYFDERKIAPGGRPMTKQMQDACTAAPLEEPRSQVPPNAAEVKDVICFAFLAPNDVVRKQMMEDHEGQVLQSDGQSRPVQPDATLLIKEVCDLHGGPELWPHAINKFPEHVGLTSADPSLYHGKATVQEIVEAAERLKEGIVDTRGSRSGRTLVIVSQGSAFLSFLPHQPGTDLLATLGGVPMPVSTSEGRWMTHVQNFNLGWSQYKNKFTPVEAREYCAVATRTCIVLLCNFVWMIAAKSLTLWKLGASTEAGLPLDQVDKICEWAMELPVYKQMREAFIRLARLHYAPAPVHAPTPADPLRLLMDEKLKEAAEASGGVPGVTLQGYLLSLLTGVPDANKHLLKVKRLYKCAMDGLERTAYFLRQTELCQARMLEMVAKMEPAAKAGMAAAAKAAKAAKAAPAEAAKPLHQQLK